MVGFFDIPEMGRLKIGPLEIAKKIRFIAVQRFRKRSNDRADPPWADGYPGESCFFAPQISFRRPDLPDPE